MADKIPQLLEHLSRSDGWVSAGELADRIGVSTRTVRSYVTAVKTAASPLEVIASSTSGYRLNPDEYARYLADGPDAEASPERPRERANYLITRLAQASDGLDVYGLAAALFVSDSTLEADLRRVRAVARDCGVELVREGSVVRLAGAEDTLRRLMSQVFREETARGPLGLRQVQDAFGIGDLSGFKTDLVSLLQDEGYAVNEFGLDGVLVHTAIALERSRTGHARTEPAAGTDDLEAALAPLVVKHFGAELPPGELRALADLLTTRVGTRRPPAGRDGDDDATARVPADDLTFVRTLLERAGKEFLVDLDDEGFLVRLTMHVGNLARRARSGGATRNPLTRSIKTSYPLTYELAVFLASEIQRRYDITVSDDEIAFIALHVGAHLERNASPADAVSCTIVSPGYHDLGELLRKRLESAFGSELRIERVIARTDPDPPELTSDLIVSSTPSIPRTENVVLVQPFPTDADVDAVRAALSRVRRHRRRARLKDELLLYFDESLFLRDVSVPDPDTMIRALGERLMLLGVADQAYVDGVIERERLSSTAFTEHLAVPHSMTMSASRTAIAIALNDTPMPWGDNRVNVVALAAFSDADRAAFQTVFEQFVEVFANHADVQRLLRGSEDFRSFIDELVRLIDA
ncbi:transcription antiterminator [Herbiconiux sp. L3-i23]|uniref:BglG family transcription antiterminator n=1 Tax=Herbiconiux sp. L3-i23 TaxID=2905871 RepID=UPI0020631122|nr:PTS sugar transporter subunit IIA [Herbiconiux sp. L3-i23]BDI23861.1 transcriptional antiterminator [Herbiconiux sp. L3-i23]